MNRLAVLNIVGLTEPLIGPHTPLLDEFLKKGAKAHIAPAFPAETESGLRIVRVRSIPLLCQVLGGRKQVSGVRCQVSGVRRQGRSVPLRPIADPRGLAQNSWVTGGSRSSVFTPASASA